MDVLVQIFAPLHIGGAVGPETNKTHFSAKQIIQLNLSERFLSSHTQNEEEALESQFTNFMETFTPYFTTPVRAIENRSSAA